MDETKKFTPLFPDPLTKSHVSHGKLTDFTISPKSKTSFSPYCIPLASTIPPVDFLVYLVLSSTPLAIPSHVVGAEDTVSTLSTQVADKE